MIQHIKMIVGSKRVAGWLRWVALPLCLASMLAFSVANSAPADAVHAKPRLAVDIAASGVGDGEVQELKTRLKELEDLSRQNYALELEGQRKKIDWWLTFIGVMAAIMAIGGALIPFLMARKDKEIIEQDKKAIEQDKVQIRMLLDEVRGMKVDAENSVEEIHRHEAEAKAAKDTVLSFQSGTPSASDKEVREAVEKIEQDKTADPLLRLRAEAVAASQAENESKAYTLWAALAELVEDDASAQFNAGYWAHELADQAQADEKLRWLRQAGKHYSKALSVESDKHEAVYNWGIALAAEATALFMTDLEGARVLWKLAGEKYQLALSLKSDDHDAANNWGTTLVDEATALADSDLETARALWEQAGEKYQLALNIKPDKRDAAYNWGIALAHEAKALSLAELEVARALWKLAGEKYQLALSIEPDDYEAANNWGAMLATEARVLSLTNIEAARVQWRLPGEKFQLALGIKPSLHEALSNWCYALLFEARALTSIDSKEFEQRLELAEQFFLADVDAVSGVVAYKLACIYGLRGDAKTCLRWLHVSQDHKALPDCKHLNEDSDLNPVRNDPEFIAWLQQSCPSHEAAATQDNKA